MSKENRENILDKEADYLLTLLAVKGITGILDQAPDVHLRVDMLPKIGGCSFSAQEKSHERIRL